MIMLKLAFRNVFRHRTRSLITLSGIAFGCIAIIFVCGFFADTLTQMRESYIHSHTGHLQIFRGGYFAKGSAKPFDYLIEDPRTVRNEISSISGVQRVGERIQFAAMLSTGETSTSCFAQGVQTNFENSIIEADLLSQGTTVERAYDNKGILQPGSVISSGRKLSDERPYGITIGKGLAGGIGARAGDTLILMTNTVGGAMNAIDVSVEGIFYTSSKEFDDHSIRLPIQTAQQFLGTTSVQSLVVYLENTADTPAVQAELARRFKQKGWDLEIKPWTELNDFYMKTEVLFWTYYRVVIVVVCVIVILSVFNTMNMSILERTSEIGSVMAMGMKPRAVIRMFFFEGTMLGAIGGMLGMLLGVLLLASVKQIGIDMPPPPGATIAWLSKPVLVPAALIQSFALSVVISGLSGLFSAYKASRMEIAQALRHVL